MDQVSTHNMLFVMLCVLGIIVLILAIIGCSKGSQRKIVVYDSKADLVVTCVSIISSACSGFTFGSRSDAPVVFWLLFLPSIVLVSNSIKRSVRANRTAWEGILSVFAKYTFVILFVLSGMVAVIGTLSAARDAKKKDYKQAAANGVVAALGVAGFVSLRKLICQLIEEPRPIIAETASPSAGTRNAIE